MRKKINTVSLIVIISVWSIGIFIIFNLDSVKNNLNKLNDYTLPDAVELITMENQVNEIKIWTVSYAVSGNIVRNSKTVKEWLDQSYYLLMEEIKKHNHHERQNDSLFIQTSKKIEVLSQQLISQSREIVILKDKGVESDILLKEIQENMFPVFYNLTEVVLKNIETDNMILKQSANDAQYDYESIFSGVVIFGILFTVLLALFTLYVNKAIILYVSQIEKHQNHLEELVKERTQELHELNISLLDKTKKLEKSQTAMRYLIEDVNSSRDELKKVNEKLFYANEELGAFTHTVSHDLRAPLRALIGYSNIFIEDYNDLVDDDGKEVLDHIKTAAVKMQNMTSDLLTLSRVSRSVISKQKLHPKEMINEQFNEFSVIEKERKIDFEISESIPDIQADKVLFSQILQNLIGNAVKYTQKEEIAKIKVTCTEEADLLTITIEDNGAGFDEQNKHKLFNIFQRLHTEKDFPGTGIGLSIALKAAEKHGWKLDAESSGKGSRFHIRIPQKM